MLKPLIDENGSARSAARAPQRQHGRRQLRADRARVSRSRAPAGALPFLPPNAVDALSRVRRLRDAARALRTARPANADAVPRRLGRRRGDRAPRTHERRPHVQGRTTKPNDDVCTTTTGHRSARMPNGALRSRLGERGSNALRPAASGRPAAPRACRQRARDRFDDRSPLRGNRAFAASRSARTRRAGVRPSASSACSITTSCPTGQHAWDVGDVCRAWDFATYGNALIARFFATERSRHLLPEPSEDARLSRRRHVRLPPLIRRITSDGQRARRIARGPGRRGSRRPRPT